MSVVFPCFLAKSPFYLLKNASDTPYLIVTCNKLNVSVFIRTVNHFKEITIYSSSRCLENIVCSLPSFFLMVFSDCGDPGIAHSTFIGVTTYNSNAFVLCDTGYDAGTRGGLMTCQETGLWSVNRSCNPVGG